MVKPRYRVRKKGAEVSSVMIFNKQNITIESSSSKIV